MFLHLDGRYRKTNECNFLEQVEEELTNFVKNSKHNRVLVFPPLASQYRFLIHQLVGNYPALQTVSIGQGKERRTVVYRGERRESSKMEPSASPVQRKFFGRGRARQTKRPDQALYVPGAMRQAKKGQQEGSSRSECLRNKAEDKELGSYCSDGGDSRQMDKHSQPEYHEAKTAKCIDGSITPLSSEEEEISNVPGSSSSEGQFDNVKSRLSTDQELRKSEEKGAVNQTLADVFASDTSLVLQIKDNSLEGQNKNGDINDQGIKEELQCSKTSVRALDTNKKSLKKEEECELSPLENCEESGINTLLEDGCDKNNSESKVPSSLGKDESNVVEDDIELCKKESGHEGVNPKLKMLFIEGIEKCHNVPERVLFKPSCRDYDAGSVIANSDFSSTGENINDKLKESEESCQCSVKENLEGCKEGIMMSDSNRCNFQDTIIQGTHVVGTISSEMSMCLDEAGKTESLNDKTTDGLVNSAEKSEGLGTQLGISEEKHEEEPLATQSQASLDVELNLNPDTNKLQEKLSETCSNKKKKSKKEMSKDGDKKVKSKEKKEKKKKKEKKSEKIAQTENDKETSSESELIKGDKKPMTKELTYEESNSKDTKTRNRVRKEHEFGVIKGDREDDCSPDDDGDDDDWESNYNESGDCLRPDQIEELSRLSGIANPEVQKTQFDFYSFTPKSCELDDDEFGHIVEIYNFSSDLKTQDIMQSLNSFRSKGFDIKWVDDTHALGIFSSSIAAQDAIRLCSTPLMKLRPISQGTPESKKKASNCFENLQPYRERPQTSKLLADRLVTGALGMRSKMTKEERVKEREKLKEAKNRKRQEEQEKAKIWAD